MITRQNEYQLNSEVLYADINENYSKFDLIIQAISDWGNGLSEKTVKLLMKISGAILGVFIVRIGGGFILGRGE